MSWTRRNWPTICGIYFGYTLRYADLSSGTESAKMHRQTFEVYYILWMEIQYFLGQSTAKADTRWMSAIPLIRDRGLLPPAVHLRPRPYLIQATISLPVFTTYMLYTFIRRSFGRKRDRWYFRTRDFSQKCMSLFSGFLVRNFQDRSSFFATRKPV